MTPQFRLPGSLIAKEIFRGKVWATFQDPQDSVLVGTSSHAPDLVLCSQGPGWSHEDGPASFPEAHLVLVRREGLLSWVPSACPQGHHALSPAVPRWNSALPHV